MTDDLQALQHLLRHLNDGSGLMTNPLVAHLFDESTDADRARGRVRNVVVETLDALLERHAFSNDVLAIRRRHAILRRCDVDGESHKLVAGDLGLSMRQFYRERLAATQWLAPSLLEALARTAYVLECVPSEAELRIDVAGGLHNYARFEDAAAILRDVARSGADLVHRLAAATALVDTLANLGRSDEISALLSDLRAECYERPSDDPLPEAQLHLAEAFAASADGKNVSFVDSLERALYRLSLASGSSNRFHREVEARASLRLAKWYIDTGDLTLADDFLARTRNALDARAPHQKVHVLSQILLQAEIDIFLGNLTHAQPLLSEALTLSQQERLPVEVMHAMQGMAVMTHHRGEGARAAAYARRVYALAETLSTLPDMVWALSLLARVELEARRPAEALALIAKAQQAHRPASERSIVDHASLSQPDQNSVTYLAVGQVEALAAMGELVPALELSEHVRALLERHNRHRTLAMLHYVRAGIFHEMRRRKDAVDAIERAVQFGQRYGSAHTAGQIYSLAASITGSHAYRERAKEILTRLAS